MSKFFQWFLIGLLSFIGLELWELKQERAEFDSALLQLNDRGVYLDEYTRILALEIADLKGDKR